MSDVAPKVSIGMPIYNGAQYIRQAIESVLAQDFADFELIVSDNASTDGTYEICQEYANDPRVRLYRNERNVGAAPNYNKTVVLARGPYFKWACHDDWLASEFLSKCVEALDKDPGAVLAYPRTIVVDDDGNYLRHYDEKVDASSPDTTTRFLNLYWNLDLCNMIFGVMRIDVLRSTRMHPNFWEGDRVLLAELALRGRFIEVPEHLFYRRFGSPRSDRTFVWWDAANRNRLTMKRSRQYFYHLKAVSDSGLGLSSKVVLGSNVLFRFAVGRKGKQALTGVTSAATRRLQRRKA
jgi:glycosyltransferase involved in cell wall biosynthesis